MCLLPCCQDMCFKNPLEEPQDQKLVVRTSRLDIIPSVPSKAHMTRVPLHILFFSTMAAASVHSYLLLGDLFLDYYYLLWSYLKEPLISFRLHFPLVVTVSLWFKAVIDCLNVYIICIY